jgi:hypothetical protein
MEDVAMRGKSTVALCFLTALASAALISPGYGGDLRFKEWSADKRAILFLPQQFETVPWLGLKSAPGQKTDFPIGMNAGTIEALRLQTPPTQVSNNRDAEARYN